MFMRLTIDLDEMIISLQNFNNVLKCNSKAETSNIYCYNATRQQHKHKVDFSDSKKK